MDSNMSSTSFFRPSSNSVTALSRLFQNGLTEFYDGIDHSCLSAVVSRFIKFRFSKADFYLDQY